MSRTGDNHVRCPRPGMARIVAVHAVWRGVVGLVGGVTSSVVQSWELGLRLRERREQLGLTAALVGKTTGIGGTNLSAIEGGKRRLTAAKLTDLAGVYDLSAPELAEWEAIRARAERHEWYHDYTTIYSEEFLRFLGLEAGAASERGYQAELIPGLLQTADYARATIKGGSPYIRPVEVGPRLESRLARQARLSGQSPLHLSVVINQAALLQQVGGPTVLAHSWSTSLRSSKTTTTTSRFASCLSAPVPTI
jgi:transcriptional regulator with XRE-family HTH domain